MYGFTSEALRQLHARQQCQWKVNSKIQGSQSMAAAPGGKKWHRLGWMLLCICRVTRHAHGAPNVSVPDALQGAAGQTRT